MQETTFVLDDWHVDTARGRISRGKVTAHLEPQVMKVLAYLARNADRVVTREEFFENLWDHPYVGDAALTRCIFEIRRAFGDDSRNPRIVETVPKIGFRLVAQPSFGKKSELPVRRPLLWGLAASLVAALALLLVPADSGTGLSARIEGEPWAALTAYERGQVYLVRRTRVSNENAIALFERAIAIDSGYGLAYAGLADALSHQALYWGGDRLVEAQQAAAMAMQLAPDQPQAHNALGLAQFLAGEDDAALASFHQAHELDQAYADPLFNAAEIHRRRLEFPRAASLFHAVVERAPDHVIAKGHLGFLYLRMGDIDRARSWLGTVIDDMPMEAYANAQMATLELVAGNTAAAIGICERVYRVFPAHRRCLHILGGANLKLGNHDAAMQWFRVLGSTFAGNQYALLGEAQVLIANGELRQGEALVEEVLLQATAAAQSPEASWSDYWTMAACLALKGEADQAFEWLEKAAAAGRRFHLWDARDDMFAPLRSDERFAKYVALTESLSNRGT